MIEKVLTNVPAVHNDGDTVLLEFWCRTNTREHEELGGLEDTLRDDDFVLGGQGKLLSSRGVNYLDTRAHLRGGIDNEFFGLDGRENSDVGFSVQVQEASLASSLVDSVQAVCETM